MRNLFSIPGSYDDWASSAEHGLDASILYDDSIHPHLKHTAKRVKEMGYTALFGVQHEAAHERVNAVMGFDERIATDPWPNADITRHYAADWLRDPARKKSLSTCKWVLRCPFESFLQRQICPRE